MVIHEIKSVIYYKKAVSYKGYKTANLLFHKQKNMKP